MKPLLSAHRYLVCTGSGTPLALYEDEEKAARYARECSKVVNTEKIYLLYLDSIKDLVGAFAFESAYLDGVDITIFVGGEPNGKTTETAH